MFGVGKYLRAAWLNIGPAIFEAGFVAGVSLLPLFLARLTPLIRGEELALGQGWLWKLLTNGQLAFYALGTLAAIALLIFRGDDALPKSLRILFGTLILFFLIFISYLVGVDPTLSSAPTTFVGPFAFWIYLITQAMAVAALAYDKFSLADVNSETANELANMRSELTRLRAQQK